MGTKLRLSIFMLNELKTYIQSGKTILDWLNEYKLQYNESTIDDLADQLKTKLNYDIYALPAYTLSQSAKNLGSALIGATKLLINGESAITELQLSDQRIAICNTCPEFEKGRCKKCGCLMKYKSKLKSGSCPIGKW